jgi:hypothetical protein
VDHYLANNGRLVLLESPADLPAKLSVKRRSRVTRHDPTQLATLNSVAECIKRLADLGVTKQGA